MATATARMPYYDIDQLKACARNRWSDILASLTGLPHGLFDERHHPCPKCAGKDRFRFTNDSGDGSILCNNCFKPGAGDGISSLQWLLGIEFPQAVKLIADYLGLEPTVNGRAGKSKAAKVKAPTAAETDNGQPEKKKDPAEHLQFLPWDEGTEIIAKLWARHKAPITLAAIKAAHGRVARYRRQYTVIALPTWGQRGMEEEPVGWSLYNASGRTLPVRRKDPLTGEWTEDAVKIKLTAGSKPGLIGPIERLLPLNPTAADGDPPACPTLAAKVWKLEGPSDLLAVLSLPDLPDDACLITNANGCGEQPKAWVVDALADRIVFILGDADRPGAEGAAKWAGAIAHKAEACFQPALPYEVAESHGKDIRDWLNEDAGRQNYAALLQLAAGLEPVEPTAAAEVSQDKIPLLNEAVDDPHRLARLYIERHGSQDGHQTLFNWLDEWHRWDGTAYRVVPLPEIRAELNIVAKAEFDRDNREVVERYIEQRDAGEIKEGKDKGPPTCRRVTCGLTNNLVNALASETILTSRIQQPSWLGGDGPFPAAEVLACESGLLHLPSLAAGQPCLLPPTPLFFSGNALPYGFDPGATCNEWLNFLGTVWPDDQENIDTLQDWFGYCLTPDTSHHKLLLLLGPPRSGKGTIGRLLAAMIGTQNVASPKLASLAGPFGLQSLVGKLVALVADARLSNRTDSVAVLENLLSIIGEDIQDIARKNLSTLTGVKLPVRFTIMSNELPNMRDSSSALLTRVILLRMTRSFQGMEDKALTERLLRELPGILVWAIRGWQRLQQRGYFQQPESGLELLSDLRDLSSPVKAFAEDTCAFHPELEATLPDLFEAWKVWCGEHNRTEPGTVEWFAKDLRAAFPKITKRRLRDRNNSSEKRVAAYSGIGIKSAWDR